jgi:hypothetical protein
MVTFTFRSMAFAASLAALMAASASAGAQPTHKHKAQVEYAALVDDPAPAVATVSHGRGAPTDEIFSRNAADCNKMLCIGY